MVGNTDPNRNNDGNDVHGRGLVWTQTKPDQITELLSMFWEELEFGDRTVTSFHARVDKNRVENLYYYYGEKAWFAMIRSYSVFDDWHTP